MRTNHGVDPAGVGKRSMIGDQLKSRWAPFTFTPDRTPSHRDHWGRNLCNFLGLHQCNRTFHPIRHCTCPRESANTYQIRMGISNHVLVTITIMARVGYHNPLSHAVSASAEQLVLDRRLRSNLLLGRWLNPKVLGWIGLPLAFRHVFLSEVGTLNMTVDNNKVYSG